MVVDGSRLRVTQGPQACVICKTRKKKCNRSLPSCGYCIRKGLDCVYRMTKAARNPRTHATPARETIHAATILGSRPPMNDPSPYMVLAANSQFSQPTAEFHQGQVYLEVHGIIRATGQFIDDISARYFQGFHRHLPVISRTRFCNNITLGASMTDDFSVLLLTICLTTYAPALGYQFGDRANPSVKQQSLYLTTKSLFAQVQVSRSYSVPLIQAGLLLAVYEYTHGRPEDAFVTIAGSARMAYAARIHSHDCHQTLMVHTTGQSADTDILLQEEERANTWWGIIICERIFFSEMAVYDQPLITIFPSGDARLPIEPAVLDQLDILDPQSLPNTPVSCLTSSNVGGFGRTAQAICLLDQVLRGLIVSDIDSRLLLLDGLDTNIQAFLSRVLPQCGEQPGVLCTAINTAIRALFTLHWHILGQPPQAVTAKFKPLEKWRKKSQEALDTVTKMVVDVAETLIAESPTNKVTHTIDAMPPTYPYIARAALRNIGSRTQKEVVGERRNEKDVLQISLDKYFQRWNVSNDWAQVRDGCGKGVS